MDVNSQYGHYRKASTSDSSDSDSLGNYCSPAEREKRLVQETAQKALKFSPAASSEMRPRRQQQGSFSRSVGVGLQTTLKSTLLQELQKFEGMLKTKKEADYSCCDCFNTPPSFGLRLEKGQVKVYNLPGGFLAEEATCGRGVARVILDELDQGSLAQLSQTLFYLMANESDPEVVAELWEATSGKAVKGNKAVAEQERVLAEQVQQWDNEKFSACFTPSQNPDLATSATALHILLSCQQVASCSSQRAGKAKRDSRVEELDDEGTPHQSREAVTVRQRYGLGAQVFFNPPALRLIPERLPHPLGDRFLSLVPAGQQLTKEQRIMLELFLREMNKK